MDPFTTTTLLLLFTEELLATDDEDFAELEDATELLDPSLEELRMTLEEEDSSELELATELLDSSLGELRMTLLELGTTLEEESSFSLEEDEDSGSVSGITLEEESGTLVEELLATEEEDVTELEEATELLLFAEELLDPSLSLRMTLEEETSSGMTSEEDEESSSSDGPFVEPPSPQAARPKASAKAPTAIAPNPKFDFMFFIGSSNLPFF